MIKQIIVVKHKYKPLYKHDIHINTYINLLLSSKYESVNRNNLIL